MTKSPVVVVGAGIVGAASAIWLKRKGLDVTLIDKGTPGHGASFGNGGILARCSIVPVTGPGLLRKAPGYLMNADFPLFLRWGYLPRLLPWLTKYLSHANASDTKRISKGLAQLLGDSVDQHIQLSKDTAAETWVETSDYNYVYRNRAAYEADRFDWDLRRAAGFVPEIIEGAAVQELEPILGPQAGLLALNRDHGYVRNPGQYVQDLVKTFTQMGGRFVQAELRDVTFTDEHISAVETDQGSFPCSQLVLATGVWSKPLMKKLGIHVPLEAERGYHIVFKHPNQMPNAPMMLAEGKFVATPMAEGLRCAGVVEFGGLSPEKSAAPLALLRKSVAQMFPALQASEEEEWLGYRPAPSDSLPLIGEIRRTGVFAAFGHHHIGLTGGPKTGRLIADLIAGTRPNEDLSPFDPMRFARRS
ncbi:FAD-dependent oxidoreductase [Epibacterium sp. SM1979]|uniref:FAD-dependent oxidoreductase n=1 Tax=Tritonibacter litoralis TaxID=2662264 RepID=A0A843YD89_9RHOB|nr:FAD-dependent oxidoreductase [Tritonibacter litoralis]MQQ07828.1 FAD-dependent oxidoreductase [Tritonibacter litoralis]